MSNDSHHDKHHEGDVAFIRSLAELLNSSELNEIQVKREYGEHDRLTVSLTKQGKQVVYAQRPRGALRPGTAGIRPGARRGHCARLAAPAPIRQQLPGAVTSPMVGTAYLSAEPGRRGLRHRRSDRGRGRHADDRRSHETMNHIPAPRAGTVRPHPGR